MKILFRPLLLCSVLIASCEPISFPQSVTQIPFYASEPAPLFIIPVTDTPLILPLVTDTPSVLPPLTETPLVLSPAT